MARKVNHYLARMEAVKSAELLRHERFVCQFCADMMLIAANDALGCGSKRLKLLFETFCAAYSEYGELLAEDQQTDKDFTYTRDKLDRKLQQIMGEHFRPWEERYGY